MELIVGEHFSGKSSKAINLIKDKDKVLYISLDNDSSVKKNIESNTKANFKYIKNCFLIDIEFSIIGSTYTTIVIDTINFIKLSQNINHEVNLKNILKGLEYLHYTYDVDIIAIYSLLRNVDRMKTNVYNIDKNDWNLIELKCKNDKKVKSKTKDPNTPPPIPKTGVVPEGFW